jgi:hypothetical protein
VSGFSFPEALSAANRKVKRMSCRFLYARAVERASKKRFTLAMSDLNKIYELLSPSGPTAIVPLVANMLMSLVALRLGDYSLSLRAAIVGAQQLRSEALSSRRYRAAERVHLMKYARIVADRAAYLGGLKVPKDEFTWETAASMGEWRVRMHIRTTFPVTEEHPNP